MPKGTILDSSDIILDLRFFAYASESTKVFINEDLLDKRA